jgi:hypothetical protein
MQTTLLYRKCFSSNPLKELKTERKRKKEGKKEKEKQRK